MSLQRSCTFKLRDSKLARRSRFEEVGLSECRSHVEISGAQAERERSASGAQADCEGGRQEGKGNSRGTQAHQELDEVRQQIAS